MPSGGQAPLHVVYYDGLGLSCGSDNDQTMPWRQPFDGSSVPAYVTANSPERRPVSFWPIGWLFDNGELRDDDHDAAFIRIRPDERPPSWTFRSVLAFRDIYAKP